MCNGSSPSSSINFFALCNFFSKYLLLLAEHTNCKDSRVLLMLYKVFQYSPQPSLHSFCSAYSSSLLVVIICFFYIHPSNNNHDMKFSPLLSFMSISPYNPSHVLLTLYTGTTLLRLFAVSADENNMMQFTDLTR